MASGRRSRIARKAAHVERTEIDREFNVGLGELKRERDEAFKQANAAYDKAVEKARDSRVEARVAAAKVYDEGRAKLLKKLATKEQVAA